MDNAVTLTGTLGGDPARRSTTGGDVTTFSLAYTSRIRTPEGGWVDGQTSWFEVSAWGALGKNALRSLRKGQRAIVHGAVSIHEYPMKDGGTGRKTQIRASAIGHDLTFGTSDFTRAVGVRPQPQQVEQQDDAEPTQRAAAGSDDDALRRAAAPLTAGWDIPADRPASTSDDEVDVPF